jgi:hypothetical protein
MAEKPEVNKRPIEADILNRIISRIVSDTLDKTDDTSIVENNKQGKSNPYTPVPLGVYQDTSKK